MKLTFRSMMLLFKNYMDPAKIDEKVMEREFTENEIGEAFGIALKALRTHKGYLVNLKYIRRIDGSGITLSNGAVVGLSRTKVQEVKAQYLKYLRKTGASLINK